MADKLIFFDEDFEVLERRGLFGSTLFLRYDTGDLTGTVRTDRISASDVERVKAGAGSEVAMELKRRLGW